MGEGMHGQTDLAQRIRQRVRPPGLDVEQHQLLLRGEPDPPGAVLVGEVGEGAQHRSADPPDDRRGTHVHPTIALRMDPDVVARTGRDRVRRGPSSSVRCRYSVSSTSRNRAAPQSATRNFSRARLRRRR